MADDDIGHHRRAVIVGIGAALPGKTLDNKWFEDHLETSDTWIRQRTGISCRSVLSDKDPDGIRGLLVRAAEEACASERAALGTELPDLLICASTTPSDLFGDAPAIALALAEHNLVCKESAAFDVRAGCNGFLVAMITATKYLESGLHRKAVVVGGEAFSQWMDWGDRCTSVLFGDGAGAVVMEMRQGADSGLIASLLRSRGDNCLALPLQVSHSESSPCYSSPCSSTRATTTADSLEQSTVDSGESVLSACSIERAAGPAASYGSLKMRGSEVFSFATTEVPSVIRSVVEDASMQLNDIQWFVLHQANSRILQIVAEDLGVPPVRMLSNIDQVGNVGAASIPLLLKDAAMKGTLRSGDNVVIAAFGAGLSWGAAVLRWADLPALSIGAAAEPKSINEDAHLRASMSPCDAAVASVDEAVDHVLMQVVPELSEVDGDLRSVVDSLSCMLFAQRMSLVIPGIAAVPATLLMECDSVEQVKLAVRDLVVHASVGRVAGAEVMEDEKAKELPIGLDADFSCTSLQRTMILRHISDPEGQHFIESFVWKVDSIASSTTCSERLKEAWLAVVAANPALRSSFSVGEVDGLPRQRVWSSGTTWSDWFEVLTRPSTSNLEQTAQRVALRQRRSLNLMTPPLFRLALVSSGDHSSDGCRFVLTLPHAIVDGYSMGLIMSDLASAYCAGAGFGNGCEVLGQRPSFESFARRQVEDQVVQAAGDYLHSAVKRHCRNVEGVSGPLTLSTSSPVTRARCRAATVFEPLQHVARSLRTTVAAVVHAAWVFVWNEYLDAQVGTVLYGSTTACRSLNLVGIDAVVGPVLNTILVRVDVAADDVGIAALIHKADAGLLRARQFEAVPLAVAMETADVNEDLQVVFDYQGDGRWMQAVLGPHEIDGSAPPLTLHDATLVDRAGLPLSVRVARDGVDLVISATSETSQLDQYFVNQLVRGLHGTLAILAALGSSDSRHALGHFDLPLAVLRAGLASLTVVVSAVGPAGMSVDGDDTSAPLSDQKNIVVERRGGSNGRHGSPTAAVDGRTEAFVSASSPVERALASVIAAAVSLPGGGESLSMVANLRLLGLDSLRAMRALGAAKASGIQVSLRAMLASQSVGELAKQATLVGVGPQVLGSVRGEVVKSVPFELTSPSTPGREALPDTAPYPLFGVGAAHYVGLHASSFAASGSGGVAPQIYWEWVFDASTNDKHGPSGQVDVAKFEEALDIMVARHPTLRAAVLEDGTMLAPAEPPGRCKAQVVTPWEGDQKAAQVAVERARAAMSGRGDAIGSPYTWPLFAFRVTHTGSRSSVVHLAISLFLMDAVSDLVFRAELSKVYRALVDGSDIASCLAPAPSLSFGSYSRSLVRGLPLSSAYLSAKRFWEEKIAAGLPSGPSLPRLPPTVVAAEVDDVGRAFTNSCKWFTKEEWIRVQSNCSGHGVTVPVALLTAYCLALARHQDSAEPRFLINVLLCLRYPVHRDMDRVLGNCSSTILVDIDLRQHVAGDQVGEGGLRLGFGQAARLVAMALSESLEHAAMSGVEVMEQVNRSRGSTFAAVAPFIFTTPIGVERGTGGDAEQRDWCFREQFFSERVPHTACVNAIKDDPATGGACASLDVVVGAFPDEVIDALAGSYKEFLDLLATEDSKKLWAEPAESLLTRFAPVPAVAVPQPIAQRMLHEGTVAAGKCAASTPAIIVPCGNGRQRHEISYQELICRAGAVGKQLWSLTCAAPGDWVHTAFVVAIVMEKSWEQVVAVHAVLMVGGSYLPTEPRLWPQDRLRTVLNVSGAHAVLARLSALEVEHSWLYEVGLPVLAVGGETQVLADPAMIEDIQALHEDPTRPAYLIYTSGSSGRPKGVVCHHRGAVNTLDDLNARWRVGSSDRCLALSSLAFDLSVYDIFGLLSAGGAIVIPHPDSMNPPDPEFWIAAAEAEKVTLWNSVPAFVDMLVTTVELCELLLPSALRLCFMSGDWIPLTLPSRLSLVASNRQLGGGALDVVSMGGATEAAIWSNQYVISSGGLVPSGWSSIPYGIPLLNQSMYILREPSLVHAAPWVTGVIYIGGAGVASGYHNDVAKTAFQFIKHPETGERLFRTGDLGRMRDGLLEICGREDAQVKLNGFRVELGEVEQTLLGPLQLYGSRVKVVAAAASVQSGQLCAHVVLAGDEDSGSSVEGVSPSFGSTWKVELKERCTKQLPQYMVPAHFAPIDRLPLSANGKLQRDKLPRVVETPEQAAQQGPPDSAPMKVVLPATPVEKVLRIVLADTLGVLVDTICCEAGDFFQLGGSSVTALRLLLAIRDHPHLSAEGGGSLLLSVRDLLAGATVRKLAKLLEAKGCIFIGPLCFDEEAHALPLRNQLMELATAVTPSPSFETLTLQAGSVDSAPKVLLFNPAGASCLCYLDLVRCLAAEGVGNAIVGIDDGCITRDDGRLEFVSVSQVVNAAIPSVIEASGGARHVILGGWSYGGVIAFEVAKALSAAPSGPRVVGMCLFDAPLSEAVVHEPPEVEDAVRSTGKAAAMHFSRATDLLRNYQEAKLAMQGPRSLPFKVLDVYPALAEDGAPFTVPRFEWQEVGVGSSRSLSAPGTHWSMLSSNAGGKVVAAAVRQWLYEIEDSMIVNS